MSETTCVIPWSDLIIQPDGCASFCCDASVLLTVDGRPARLGQDSFDEIWNAPELVETRAAMARGERPDGCRVCWEREQHGGLSRRVSVNTSYRASDRALDLDALELVGRESGYHLERAPEQFVFGLGNVCNLACRSCNGLFSSKVAADSVQSAWAVDQWAPAQPGLTGDRPGAEARGRGAWFRDVEAMADMVAASTHDNVVLSLLGGEPFLIKQSWELMAALVDRGVSNRVTIGLITNGQQRSEKLTELAPHFRSVGVSVSIDGYGPLYEYLRHGGSWDRLVENLDWLEMTPGVSVVVTPTLQNTNALDMPRLLRFLDERELRLNFNAISFPPRLAPRNLPPAVRIRASAQLREYLGLECRGENVTVVRGYCDLLEADGDSFERELFEDYMTFTNDLDASRGQSIAVAAHELVAALENAGVPWSTARRHVPREPACV